MACHGDDFDQLLDAYAEECDILEKNYEYMGLMLDEDYLSKMLDTYGIHELYIYGGGFLGLQLYRSLNGRSKILGIVDKKGVPKLPISNLVVMDIDEFTLVYNGEMVIVTPTQFYSVIIKELEKRIPAIKTMFIGELLAGGYYAVHNSI